MDNIIDGSMVMVMTLTPSAAETMCGGNINLHSTMVTGVWPAQGFTWAKTNCNSNGVVVHVQAHGRNRKGIKPCTRLFC